jgi:hypothetical protein
MAAHPFMNRAYYELFGYIWYPEYLAYGCDNEFWIVGNGIGRFQYFADFRQDNRHTGWGMNASAVDQWGLGMQKTSAMGVTVLQQQDRLDSLIASIRAKLENG